jgi:hypothetical protein
MQQFIVWRSVKAVSALRKEYVPAYVRWLSASGGKTGGDEATAAMDSQLDEHVILLFRWGRRVGRRAEGWDGWRGWRRGWVGSGFACWRAGGLEGYEVIMTCFIGGRGSKHRACEPLYAAFKRSTHVFTARVLRPRVSQAPCFPVAVTPVSC